MSRDKKDKDFVHRAYYPGGTDALKKFVTSNLKYPAEAKEKGVQGSVKLQFDVDYKGSVHHVKVLSGVGSGCSEEAIRIVKLLKYKVPKTYKLRVGFKKKLNIHFRLKKEKIAKPVTTSYSYNVTPALKKSSSYNYTINIKA